MTIRTDPPTDDAPGDRSATPQTLLDKIWRAHEVLPESESQPAILYIDLHLVHEVTSPQAFSTLGDRGLSVRRPQRALATMDHVTPTREGAAGERSLSPAARLQLDTLRANTARAGIALLDLEDPRRGIVHVIGPELGRTQPGMTIVCGDSHTSTHGAFGALAFGIGSSEVAQVLATQCLIQRRPKSMAVEIDGVLGEGVTAKDLALYVIARLGVAGGRRHVIEYRGQTVRALPMEARMTLCNMSIEAGARAGMIAPDAVTFAWLRGRPSSPQDRDWQAAVARWRALATDSGARFDTEIAVDANAVEPMVTWGTHPGMSAPVGGCIPADEDEASARARAYMGFSPGQSLAGHRIDRVFVGSCTNGRLSDLRAVAQLLSGRTLASGVQMLVVPGSEQVRRDAEAEGIGAIIRGAGATWGRPGCSMCLGMNGDIARPGEYVVSTSNRNFEGRQGPGVRTLLASPLTAAACAITGSLTDPRDLLRAGMEVCA